MSTSIEIRRLNGAETHAYTALGRGCAEPGCRDLIAYLATSQTQGRVYPTLLCSGHGEAWASQHHKPLLAVAW